MVLQYIGTFILGYITIFFATVILTTIRTGLHMCNEYQKDDTATKEDKEITKIMKKKYYLTILIDSIIVISISLLVFFCLKETFSFYLILSTIWILISIPATGISNKKNIEEFSNTFNSTSYMYYSKLSIDNITEDTLNNPEDIVPELMKRSGLSEQICTDCATIGYISLSDGKNKAMELVYSTLIPHLKEEGNIYNVGVAFGMLINEHFLTEQESLAFSKKIMMEMANLTETDKIEQ